MWKIYVKILLNFTGLFDSANEKDAALVEAVK